jgi:hypothetical protein
VYSFSLFGYFPYHRNALFFRTLAVARVSEFLLIFQNLPKQVLYKCYGLANAVETAVDPKFAKTCFNSAPQNLHFGITNDSLI